MKASIKNKLKTIPESALSGIVYTISQLFTRGLAIITVPIFTRIMTSEDIGVVNIFNSWYSMLSVIVTLSLTSGGFQLAMKEFAKTRDEYESSVLTITSIMAIFVFLIYLINPLFWQQLLGLSNILIITMILGFFVAPARDFWMYRQRYEYKYKLSGIISILTATLASAFSVFIVLYFNSNNLPNIAEGRLLANYSIILSFATVFWIYIMYKGKTFFNKEYWKFSLGISIPLVGYAFAKQILDVSDRQMISKMVGNSEVGIYSILYTVSSISLIAWNAINSSFVPVLYRNINEKDKFKNVQNVSCGLLGLYSCISIIMTYFAPEIVKLLATDEYYVAIFIMPPIAAGVYLTSVSNMYSNILIYYKKTASIMVSSIIAALLNLILNYFGIKIFGYQACAYTTLISYIVLAGIQAILANKVYYKTTNSKLKIYDNKKILNMTIITIILNLFGLVLYSYRYMRYVFILFMLSIALLYIIKNRRKK